MPSQTKSLNLLVAAIPRLPHEIDVSLLIRDFPYTTVLGCYQSSTMFSCPILREHNVCRRLVFQVHQIVFFCQMIPVLLHTFERTVAVGYPGGGSGLVSFFINCN